MSLVKFASICDVKPCAARSAEYTEWPTCRECMQHACPAHTAANTLIDNDGQRTVICSECRKEQDRESALSLALVGALMVCLLLIGTAPAFAQEAIPQITTPATLNLSVMLPKTTIPAIKIPSRDSRKQRIVRGGLLFVAAALDIHSTRVAMGMPELWESNSWLYGKRAPLWRLLLVKSAINGVTWLGSNGAAYRDPVDGFMAVLPQTGWQTYAAVQNYRLIAKVKLAKAGK